MMGADTQNVTTPWLTIIGMGEDGWEGLSPRARMILENAEAVVGSARLIGFLPETVDGVSPEPLAKCKAAFFRSFQDEGVRAARAKMTELERIRHSCAHVLATAILRLWPDAQFAYGPPVETADLAGLELGELLLEGGDIAGDEGVRGVDQGHALKVDVGQRKLRRDVVRVVF